MVQHALVTVILAAIAAVFASVTGNPADVLTSALLPATPAYVPADGESAVKAFEAVSEDLGRR